MNSIQFKGKTFDFPIKGYVHFEYNQTKFFVICSFIIMLTFCAMVFVRIITDKSFGIWMFLFLLAFGFSQFILHKKPKFVIHKDKIVLSEHGLIKPKELYWKYCTLYTTFHKSNATINKVNGTSQEIPLLHFLYQDKNNKTCRFFYVNLANLRLNEHHFDKDDTLQFFETMKQMSEKL